MKEYEIVAKYFNACAGKARPETTFLEVELSCPEDFIREKHSRDFDKFVKETLPDGRLLYTYDTGGVAYTYEFTEI